MNQHDFSVVENISELREEFKISGNFRTWVNENFIPETADK